MSAVIYHENSISFNGHVNENEIAGLRTYLQRNAHNKVTFDFVNCNDIHTAVVQLLLAFKVLHESKFVFDSQYKPFRLAIEGFGVNENDSD